VTSEYQPFKGSAKRSALLPGLCESRLENFSFGELASGARLWYYHSPMREAFRLGADEYFAQIYREHFQQSYYSLNFCGQLPRFSEELISSKVMHLPPRKPHCSFFDRS